MEKRDFPIFFPAASGAAAAAAAFDACLGSFAGVIVVLGLFFYPCGLMWIRPPPWTRFRLTSGSETPNSEKIMKNNVFHRFSRNFGSNPFQNLRKTRPIILNWSQPPPIIPNPVYIDFKSLNFFEKKKLNLLK